VLEGELKKRRERYGELCGVADVDHIVERDEALGGTCQHV
jgi:hypothetical protein